MEIERFVNGAENRSSHRKQQPVIAARNARNEVTNTA